MADLSPIDLTRRLAGRVVDEHRSLLTCTLVDGPDAAAEPYRQVNEYEWADGRTERHEFPGTYRDGRLWFDTARIHGYAYETDERLIVLRWVRKDLPEVTLTELIELSPDGQHRARTWHWYRNGELFRRTLIKEQRVR